MNFSAMVYHYQEFLNPLIKWKILDTDSLQRLSDYQGSYVNFCKVIRKLKMKNLVCWEPLIHRKKRVVYLTREAQKEITPHAPYLIDDRIIFHDAIVSNIARSFLEKKYFYDSELSHEHIGNKKWNYAYILEPDAILFGENKKAHFKVAIEVELTQKSKDRIAEKINSYSRSEFFNSAFYIFHKRNVFDAYINSLREIQTSAPSSSYGKAVGQKIFLIFKEDLIRFPLDFSESAIFVNDKERKFHEVLDV